MTPSLILDLVTVSILLLFAALGIRMGFVRALCSFLAVFVAFFGAVFLARTLTPALTELVSPYALPSIVERLEGSAKSSSLTDAPSDSAEGSALLPETPVLLPAGLPDAWNAIIQSQTAEAEGLRQPFTSPSQAIAASILRIIVFGALFLLSFLLLLLIWTLLSRSLDLISKLPVLNFCNRTLGAALGLIKGLLLLLVLRWALCDLTGFLPAAFVEESLVFRWLSQALSSFPLSRLLL